MNLRVSPADLESKPTEHSAELEEAREQLAAVAEVLQLINRSAGDSGPVFEAIVEKAVRLCRAAFGLLLKPDGDQLEIVAVTGDLRYVEFTKGKRVVLGPGTSPARVLAGERVVHIIDLAAEALYQDREPHRRAIVDLAGARTLLAVPLLKRDRVHGIIVICRKEVRPFSERQIALLQSFAAQAAIALENTRLMTDLRRRTDDLQESLEQQTAIAEVMQLINSSPGDPRRIFDAMLDKAIRLCGAAAGSLLIRDGEQFTRVWTRDLDIESIKHMAPGRGAVRILAGERVVHILDMAAYTDPNPFERALVDKGVRTALLVPLLNCDTVRGMIAIGRREVRPFSDRQIALLQSFATQAAITLENAGLIADLRQRTNDLQESLEYQTAISDVLKVISRSTFDLDSVLHTVVVTAIRLCHADSAVIYRNDGGEYRWAAGDMLSPEYEKIERNVRIRPGMGTVVGRAALQGSTVQIEDAWTDPLYEAKDDAKVGGVRTMLGVPLLREGVPIGVIGLSRRRVERFTEREIQLVTTFADQSVIAIENARLLRDLKYRTLDLKQRTRDLEEALEYQTATGDVLKVISRSASELEPVLRTVLATAARLCQADKAIIYRYEGGAYRYAVGCGNDPEYDRVERETPIYPGLDTLIGRTVLEKRTLRITDAWADPLYAPKDQVKLGNVRAMLGVPLMREGSMIGAIALARSNPEPFTDKQVELVTVFADQSVIAIENARLISELRARTAELGRSVKEMRSLSEVGQAVSSTLDLMTVVSTVLSRSVALAEADSGAIFRLEPSDNTFRLVTDIGWDAALSESVGEMCIPENETAMGEAAEHRAPVQIADLENQPRAILRDAALTAGYRAVLIVPLIGPESVLGTLVLQRCCTGEFPPETVQLMQTLASQSVLAIQNAELFHQIAHKSEELALASQHKSQFLANMSHELRTPLNAILGYAELLADGIYGTLPDRPREVLERIQSNGRHLLALINEVLDLAKIEAGQLTLTVEDYSLFEVIQSVVTATEPLATAKGLKFSTFAPDSLPIARGDARRLSQVLLNLVGNAIKFTDMGEVELHAAADQGGFVITIRDTGPGIAEGDQERIFDEFQQIDNSNTRRKGGTGLGLAISRRMVEMQGGTISVSSVLGHGSEFRIMLPVQVGSVKETA
jgi:GAF domain-containing protein